MTSHEPVVAIAASSLVNAPSIAGRIASRDVGRFRFSLRDARRIWPLAHGLAASASGLTGIAAGQRLDLGAACSAQAINHDLPNLNDV